MSMDYNQIEKAINETKADIEKYLKSDEFEIMAAFGAMKLVEANRNAK